MSERHDHVHASGGDADVLEVMDHAVKGEHSISRAAREKCSASGLKVIHRPFLDPYRFAAPAVSQPWDCRGLQDELLC